MKRTLMVIQTLGQAAGLTVLAMASLAGLVFFLYCLLALTDLTLWGAVLPTAGVLFVSFCGILFAAKDLDRQEAEARHSAGETRSSSISQIRVCIPKRTVCRADDKSFATTQRS
jgi:hypothetical protein